MVKFSKKEKALILISIPIILFWISIFFPVKFCLKDYPTEADGEFYVVRYDSTKNWWILVGDKDGLQDWSTVPDNAVEFTGKDFTKEISESLYNNYLPNYFIVWGHAEIVESVDEVNGESIVQRSFTVKCKKWDLLEEVKTESELRNKLSNKYLTVYDLKWIDFFKI